MEASSFFGEVNRTENWSLKPSDFEYVCTDDDPSSELGENTVAEIQPWYQTVTITYLPTGIKKSYAAGHGSTFPVEFIDDWKDNLFKEVR